MIEFFLNIDFQPFILSFKLAFFTTVILFVIALPLSWYLSQSKSKIKPLLEAIVSLPIVLPPSVIGFYILVFLSPNSFIGKFFEDIFDINLVFNFTSLVIASCIYSFPFMVQPLQSGFEKLNITMLEASYLSGKSKLETVVKIAIPNIRPAILTACIITFAHTVGEFGVVLMLGGSIPNETKVASIAIYEFTEILDYKSAHIYSAMMLFISFVVLISVYFFNHRNSRRIGI